MTLLCFSDDQWPPPITNNVFRLAMIKTRERVRRGYTEDDSVRQKRIEDKVDNQLLGKGKDSIELREVFKGTKGHERKVLMEGGPGNGKSTLCLHICHEWMDARLFQEYGLVILVRLRELSIQAAKSIAELLPRRSDAMGQEIESVLTESDGSMLLLVLDGWDEFPQSAPAYEMILNIIKGKKLPKSSVIITSRPISSSILHPFVFSRIIILGFTKDEVHRYFMKCLENSAEGVDNLLMRIKENPIIEGSCYLPLNASVLVHLFKCRGNKLPATQYGIFTELICCCIFRHLKKTHQDIDELQSLDKLPPTVDDQFQQICKIAYDGIMEDRVIFNLGPNYNTLGLLQGVESIAVCGKSYTYNFIHLTLQEVLGAIYMATKLDASEQAEQFQKLFGRPRFNTVFQFFTAKTKLQTPEIRCVVKKIAENCSIEVPDDGDRYLLVSLLNCLYEAEDSDLYSFVADELKQKLSMSTFRQLGTADCYCLGYFLTQCQGFDVDLSESSLCDEKCKALFRQGKVYNLRSLK